MYSHHRVHIFTFLCTSVQERIQFYSNTAYFLHVVREKIILHSTFTCIKVLKHIKYIRFLLVCKHKIYFLFMCNNKNMFPQQKTQQKHRPTLLQIWFRHFCIFRVPGGGSKITFFCIFFTFLQIVFFTFFYVLFFLFFSLFFTFFSLFFHFFSHFFFTFFFTFFSLFFTFFSLFLRFEKKFFAPKTPQKSAFFPQEGFPITAH